jgi:hypothetical protein
MNSKTLSILLLVCTMAFSVQGQDAIAPAQDASTVKARVSQHSLALAKELGLDEDQTQRMAKADEQYAIAMSTLRSMTTDREVLLQKGEGFAQEHEAALQDILSPEQYEKLLAIRKAKSQEGMQKMQQLQPPATE